MKSILLGLASVAGAVYGCLPGRLRNTLAFGLFVVESRSGDPASGLVRLFSLADKLDLTINERATAFGHGEHPKHRLTKYHEFFVARIPPGARVLDIGCGRGAVARSVAERVARAEVTGIDIEPRNITAANSIEYPKNLSFVCGDARTGLPDGRWDVLVLSNILEHIADRTAFLDSVLNQAKPDRVLIRVPMFERNWQVPLRKELGVNYFSDRTHYIEHSREEIREEVRAAGLTIVEHLTPWGEHWLHCEAGAASGPTRATRNEEAHDALR